VVDGWAARTEVRCRDHDCTDSSRSTPVFCHGKRSYHGHPFSRDRITIHANFMRRLFGSLPSFSPYGSWTLERRKSRARSSPTSVTSSETTLSLRVQISRSKSSGPRGHQQAVDLSTSRCTRSLVLATRCDRGLRVAGRFLRTRLFERSIARDRSSSARELRRRAPDDSCGSVVFTCASFDQT
jgi:hypothetical protein